MERDPLRLAWKTSPGRHGLAILLLAIAGTALLATIVLVRAAVDQLVGGAPAESLFRLVLSPPAALGFAPIVLFRGFALEPAAARAAIVAGLILAPLVGGVAVLGVERMVAGIGAAVLDHVRRAILAAVLAASPSAREEAEGAAVVAGDALARESAVFGAAILAPLQAAGAIGLAVLTILVADWRIALVVAGLLIVAAALTGRRIAARVEAARARRSEGTALDQNIADLLRRLPALRAHGTGDFERERIRLDFARAHAVVAAQERRLAAADVFASLAMALVPVAALGLAAWLSAGRGLTPGEVAAIALAAAIAALQVRELTHARVLIDQLRPLLQDAARSLALLQSRSRRQAAATLPGAGPLVAAGLSAYDPASGARISGVDLSIAFPAHVALVGDGDAGTRLLASVIGGILDPSTGRLTYGGVDLAAVDPAERARRIAFAGGETILVPGTMRDNLVYGCPVAETDLDERLSAAVATAGLDRLIHARGLAGTVDPTREAALASALVETRQAVRRALVADSLDRFVDPFDATRYNQHATIGENLLFGKPIGDTFREDNLASHPFVRAILEAEDLTKPLAAMGLSIARSMIEIFADIPDGHPLFARFSFFSAADRPYFEDLVERRSERRRGAESARDRERLIGLALRYSESRHRLGLIDAAFEARLVAARADFAKMLPLSLKPSIEFYDPARLCTAASIQDNLLFGRIASDQAGADAAVHAVIRRVLTERGLDDDVSRIGLNSPVDPRGGDLTLSEIAAIDLVRCLVRRPDVLVVERALDGLPAPAADALVARLRRALIGRGLVLVSPDLSPSMDEPPFDLVVRLERGVPRVDDRQAAREAAAVA